MNNYELMVIFTPVLRMKNLKPLRKNILLLLPDTGGTVVAENPWGLKSLAYPIRKKTTGIYWVLEYTAPSDFNEKLKIQLLRDENVLRHMLQHSINTPSSTMKKRSGVPTGTEKERRLTWQKQMK